MTTRKKYKYTGSIFLVCLFLSAILISCSDSETGQNQEQQATETSVPEENAAVETDPMKNKGIGPVSSVEIGPINQETVAKGQSIFETKCAACHKLDTKYVGPALGGVTTRRTPEWIMNMIMNPVEMTQKDPIAKQLLEEHLTQMTFQDLTQEDTRAILEYFRDVDAKAN